MRLSARRTRIRELDAARAAEHSLTDTHGCFREQIAALETMRVRIVRQRRKVLARKRRAMPRHGGHVRKIRTPKKRAESYPDAVVTLPQIQFDAIRGFETDNNRSLRPDMSEQEAVLFKSTLRQFHLYPLKDLDCSRA